MMITLALLDDDTGIRHAFFTRRGGVSGGLYESLNCGFGSGDAADSVARNRGIAMGQLDLAADRLVTLAVRPETEFKWLKRVYTGLEAAARIYGVNLVGGETAKSPGPFFLSVALTGTVDHGKYVGRSGGRKGDWLYVTGKLGGSIGGRHLRFRPRVAEAQWLVSRFPVHAMMDLSDGLATDLPRLAIASCLGFEVDTEDLPLHRGARPENGLRDGEDYELLFALPPAAQKQLETEWRMKFPRLRLTAIGRLVENGRTQFSEKGYDHFAG